MSRRSRRKKYIPKQTPASKAKQKAKAKRALLIFALVIVLIIAAVAVMFITGQKKNAALTELYDSKSALLREELMSDSRDSELTAFNVEDIPESVVFISVCSGEDRAKVFTGTGKDRAEAWKDADSQAREYVTDNHYSPLWVKADLMASADKFTQDTFSIELCRYRHEFFRSGIAFDSKFETALLEAELNGAKILDYDNECIDFSYLNTYLKKAEREQLPSLPDEYIVFRTVGWLCDEDGQIHNLLSSKGDFGRRSVETIDKDYAAQLVENASGFLIDQVNKDGSFVYGIYPRFDNDISNYNIVRHASTLWSLVCQYRMTGNEDLKRVIDKAIDYMIDNAVIYSGDDTAYLYEEKSDEIKLGGCGVAVIALTEYMDAFGSDKYEDIAVKLGNGILTMLNEMTGEYYHVLNGDGTRKEEFRIVYYDGEATFALSRLYSLTRDEKWLDAAKIAVDHFIDADYVQYKDHWVAYSLNEITKYVDDERYYTFALRNAQENLNAIYYRDTTYHTYFELLMSTFELYDRMIENGIHVSYLDNGFDLNFFLRTIYKRADHMLNGYFFPEYAMYMANPNRILDTFMVRHDGYRVRIDDVQHSVGGYYLYYVNYDKLVDYGMLECRDKL